MASGYFSLYKNCIPIYSNIYIPFDEVPKASSSVQFQKHFCLPLIPERCAGDMLEVHIHLKAIMPP